MYPLDFKKANKMIQHALQFATQNNYPPMAVVVLDAGGNLKAFQRQDGASMLRFKIALGKAWTAVAMSQSSRSIAQFANTNPHFLSSLEILSEGRILPQPGGLLIKNGKGNIIGSVGVSGGTGDQDERVAMQALGLQLQAI